MIKELVIEDVATYKNPDNPCTISPNKVNYMYGCNASGKTSFTKVIHNPTEYKKCNILWENNIPKEVLTYNKDFIDNNFIDTIPGVFTFGEKDKKAIEKIDELKETKKENDSLKKRKVESYQLQKDRIDDATKNIINTIWRLECPPKIVPI